MAGAERRHRATGMALAMATVAAAVLAIGALVVAVVVEPGPESGVDRVRNLVAWPDSCAAVETRSPVQAGVASAWSHATDTASVSCEHAGPFVQYARFESAGEMRRDLLRHPPSAAVCIAGEEVVVDGLDEGQFLGICRSLNGDLVDAVADLPRPRGRSIAEIQASVSTYQRRATAAQGRALRRYWRRGTG